MARQVPSHIIRRQEYPVEDILARKKLCRRLQVYKHKGTKCVDCGIEGTFFAWEKHRKQNEDRPEVGWHYNLYADTPSGGIRLMTVDHIVPVSRGGAKKKMKNLQPMCAKCNGKKGNRLPGEIIPSPHKKKLRKRVWSKRKKRSYWQRMLSWKDWKRRLKWMWYNRRLPRMPRRCS